MIKEEDWVQLGLTCAEICQMLDRGINGGQQEQLSQSVLEAIERLNTWVWLAVSEDLLTKLSIVGP